MTMPRRTPVLLTSLRPSSKYRQTISKEEAESFWMGCFALWHPAVLAESTALPALGSADEFGSPQTDYLFVMPESPYRYQSVEWPDQVRNAGSEIVTATTDWKTTVEHLAHALSRPVEDLLNADWMPFAGLAMGYLILEANCDSQDHTNPLDQAAFHETLRQAAGAEDSAARRSHLEQAAQQLKEAREVVNPSQLYQAVTLFLSSESAEASLCRWLETPIPFTIVSSSHWMQTWSEKHPTLSAELKTRLSAGSVDWWGGHFQEQEDSLLPVGAWLANLARGIETANTMGKSQCESHGRSRFAASPVMPAILQSFGYKRALGFSNDGGVWPHFNNSLAAWRGPDSTLLESCTRNPEPLEAAETPFHLGYLLHECTASEYVGWIHLGCKEPCENVPLWLQCWSALHQLSPVFGHLGTLEQTIRDIPATEQYTPTSADDFQSDYLLDLTGHSILPAQPDPVSRFALAQQRWRQREACRILTSMLAAISPSEALNNIDPDGDQTTQALTTAALRLAARLTRGVEGHTPGYLIFNACSFSRKVPVQLPQCTTLLPSPSFASQKSEQGIDAVVDLPPLGFAWVPQAVAKGAKVRIPRQPVVQGNTLQNEYLALEVDPQTGGLRSIRDAVKQIPRLGQQLVFGPGSTMQCDEIRVLRSGHAVGKIQSIGKLVDAHGQPLAGFRQTFRLWSGKKYAEIDMHLTPGQPMAGYPWHTCFASRWAWRDSAARISKSVHWTKMPVMQTRPETQGFIELETTQGRTAIFSGGLPFWQRHGTRMLDTLLLVEGESSTSFKFAISLDDDLPHSTEQDWLTPAVAVPVDAGPPRAGTTSWLFHLDAPSVLLFDMTARQGDQLTLTLRLIETYGYATDALLQCPVRPMSGSVVNSLGEVQRSLMIGDDGVALHLGCYEFQQIELHFPALGKP